MNTCFFPWLFNDKSAWENTLADSRYSYDLTMSQFMVIYHEYISGTPGSNFISAPKEVSPISSPAPKSSTPSQDTSSAGQILSQDEIDSLLTSLNN